MVFPRRLSVKTHECRCAGTLINPRDCLGDASADHKLLSVCQTVPCGRLANFAGASERLGWLRSGSHEDRLKSLRAKYNYEQP